VARDLWQRPFRRGMGSDVMVEDPISVTRKT